MIVSVISLPCAFTPKFIYQIYCFVSLLSFSYSTLHFCLIWYVFLRISVGCLPHYKTQITHLVTTLFGWQLSSLFHHTNKRIISLCSIICNGKSDHLAKWYPSSLSTTYGPFQLISNLWGDILKLCEYSISQNFWFICVFIDDLA